MPWEPGATPSNLSQPLFAQTLLVRRNPLFSPHSGSDKLLLHLGRYTWREHSCGRRDDVGPYWIQSGFNGDTVVDCYWSPISDRSGCAFFSSCNVRRDRSNLPAHTNARNKFWEFGPVQSDQSSHTFAIANCTNVNIPSRRFFHSFQSDARGSNPIRECGLHGLVLPFSTTRFKV